MNLYKHDISKKRKLINVFSVQISEAFRKFGLSDSDSGVLVVLTDDGTKALNSQEIISHVEGQQVPLAELSQLTDFTKVRKVLKSIRSIPLLFLFECIGVLWERSILNFSLM